MSGRPAGTTASPDGVTAGPSSERARASGWHGAPVSQIIPTPASRLRAPSWRDPRLVVGVLLVLASVVAGGRLAAASDASVRVWAARATLASGDEVTATALVAVRVGLRESAPRYLSADVPPPRGLVALRTVGAGELVPATSVGDASRLERAPLGLPYEGEVPRAMVKGALVDVWVTPPPPSATSVLAGGDAAQGGDGSGGPAAPTVLAGRVEVTEVSASSGAFASSRGRTVSVALSRDQVAQALAARSAGAQIALLLVPGSSPERR